MKPLANVLDRLVTAGLILIVLVAPTQYALEILGNTHLCLVDPLVWLVALLWGVARWQNGKLGTIKGPPLVTWLFLALAAFSVVGSGHLLKSAKDIIQFAEYFLAAYMLFADTLDNGRKLRTILYVFLGVAAAVILLGLAQYLVPSVPVLEVSGSFGNRNVFGGFLALTLPLMYGILLYETNRWLRAGLLLVILAGLAATLAGGTLIAVLVAGAVLSAFRGQVAFFVYGIVVALVLAFGLHLLPRDNPDILRQSVVMYSDDALPARRYVEWQAALAMAQENVLRGVGIGNYQEHVGEYLGVLPNVAIKAEADSQNLYLVLASSMGVPALLCFLGMLALFARRALNCFFHGDAVFHKGLALGLFGSLLAFSINAVWAPLIVRGIGVPLACVAGLAAALEQLRRRG